MKLTGAEAARFCAGAPPKDCMGALLYGPDSGLVRASRDQLATAILGPEADDLRHSRLDASIIRKEPDLLETHWRTSSFFPGSRLVEITGGQDGLRPALEAILCEPPPPDVFLLVTADTLPPRSGLRKFFESAAGLAALALYPRAPTGREIAARLTAKLTPEAEDALQALAQQYDHGPFDQLLRMIDLYACDAPAPLGLGDIEPLLPEDLSSQVDDCIFAVAGGAVGRVAPLLRQTGNAGLARAAVLGQLIRYFRQLLELSTSSEPKDQAIARLRPPVFGPRRAAMRNHLNRWSGQRLEMANRILFQLEGALRSANPPPEAAQIERTFLRLAMMANQSAHG